MKKRVWVVLGGQADPTGCVWPPSRHALALLAAHAALFPAPSLPRPTSRRPASTLLQAPRRRTRRARSCRAAFSY